MQIYLVRHGEDLNPNPGYLSDKDVSLSETGRQQATDCALKLKEILGKEDQLQIITSPRVRTTETASILGKTLNIDSENIQKDVRLKERDCHSYAGQSVKEVFSTPEEDLIKGGMESYDSLYNRLKSVYDKLTMSDQTTIIVTHSGNVQPLLQISSHEVPQLSTEQSSLTPDSFMRLC